MSTKVQESAVNGRGTLLRRMMSALKHSELPQLSQGVMTDYDAVVTVVLVQVPDEM